MARNTGAVFTAVEAPLEVKEVEYPAAGEGEIVVKARAVAINPCDYAMQMFGPAVFKALKLPCVFGEDVAGEVESVGPKVSNVKVGDRVAGLGFAVFQEHVSLKAHLAIPIPAFLSFEQAAVIPMGLAVATMGLFHKDNLGLHLPSRIPKPTGETVLIWGASTSVGSNAVQLAAAAGYEVIATASPANFDRARQLGASQVFDYNSPTITEDLIAAFAGKKTPGAFCNGGPSPPSHPPIISACAAVVAATEGRKFLALTMVAQPGAVPDGIESNFVQVPDLRGDEQLATAVLHDYVPDALADGSYVATPRAEVVGKGLDAIQGAMDMLKKGVSATKLVVTL